MLEASTMKPLNGSTVVLNCTAKASPAAQYRFYHVDGSGQTEISNAGSGILTINNINYADFNGYIANYRCIPYNSLGNGQAKDVRIDIQGQCILCHFNVFDEA